jgi:hypothetical protein
VNPANYPKNAAIITMYEHLAQVAKAFSSGNLNLLILLGSPGLAKSRTVRDMVGDCCWIEGNATAFGIYCQLYKNKNKLIVVDDPDDLHADNRGIRLFKCLCQTEPRKRLRWTSDTTRRNGSVPEAFWTRSRVAIVANDWRTLDANVRALEDRGHVFVFQPSTLEVHSQVAKWFWDQEIFDFIARYLHLLEQPSMRHYMLAWEAKQAGLDWRYMFLSRCLLKAKSIIAAQIRSNPAFATQEARVKAFIAAGGGSRGTWFRIAKKLQPMLEVPALELLGNAPTWDDPGDDDDEEE